MNRKRVLNNRGDLSTTLKKSRKVSLRNDFKKEKYIPPVKYHLRVPRDYLSLDLLTTEALSVVESFPVHVRNTINYAIAAAINLCPIVCHLYNVENDDNYRLDVQYEDPSTEVMFQYMFPKCPSAAFEDYFSPRRYANKTLHRCKIVTVADKCKQLRFSYGIHNWIDVIIKQNGRRKDPFDLLNSKKVNDLLPDTVSRVPVCQQPLFEAVMAHLFPTKAHHVACLIDIRIDECEACFRESMTCSSIIACLFQPIALPTSMILKCVIRCHLSKLTRPLLDDDDPSTGGHLETMDRCEEELRKLYPFFERDSIRNNTISVYDIWVEYFGSRKQLPETVSDVAFDNLLSYYVSNPKKYAFLMTRYPDLAAAITKKDFQARKKRLDEWLLRDPDSVDFIDEEIAMFNRLPTDYPHSQRAFILNSNDPNFRDSSIDSGTKVKITCAATLLRKIELEVMPKAFCDFINIVDVEYDRPLPLFELANKISYMMKQKKKRLRSSAQFRSNDTTVLNPSSLEEKFAKHKFSAGCENTPTEDDCLAVRYAQMYQKRGYKVPEIPAKFFERFERNKGDASNSDVMLNMTCIVCLDAKIEYIFPKCFHLCLCERCSFALLKCPICYEDSIPTKVYY